MSSLVILQSDADELLEIDERLRKDGFTTDITAEHKLRYLWRQLSRSETSLASSFETVEELRKQHSQEMIEVETYVEHIRQLSSEREALTLELEVENEKLKADLDDMKNDQELNMLGIVDVIALLKESNVNFEHVQNKLDMKDCLVNVVRQCNQALDRVRFLELENGNLKMAGSSSDSQRVQMLEEERTEMENEINKMHENMRLVKQEETKIHKEEMEKIRAERMEVQSKLNASEKKCKDFQMEVLNLKRKIEDEQRAHNKDLTEMIKKQNALEGRDGQLNIELEERLKKALVEMHQVQNKQDEVVKEKVELYKMVEDLEKELKSEKESLHVSRIKDETILKDVKKELDKSKQQCMELQIKMGKLETEKNHCENQFQKTAKELAELQEITSQKEKNLSMEHSSSQRFQAQIREFKDAQKKIEAELERAKENLNEKQNIIDQLTLKLTRLETDKKKDENKFADAEKGFHNQINALQKQLSLAKSEADELRNDLMQTKADNDELILRIKEESEKLNKKYNEDVEKHLSTSSEVVELRAQISDLKQDLNTSLSASVARERETSDHVVSLEKTRNELVSELGRCIEQNKKMKEEADSEKSRIDHLEQEKSSLQSIILSQERKVSEIQNKLQQTERKLAEQEGVLSYERHRHTDVNERLEMSIETLANSRLERESLREEIKVLSEKLLKQHDAALDSQSKYDTLVTQLRTEMQNERETYAIERHKLASHLEQTIKENKDLSLLLRQREEELNRLQSEFNTTSRTGAKASTALEFESRLRETLENKNVTLENELTKAWEQTKSLMERLTAIESDKGQLERDYERKCQIHQLTEDNLHKKDADVVNLMVARDTAEQRAEAANLKLLSIQRERDNIQEELERIHKELGEAYQVKAELELTREESSTLKSQLDEEEQNRSLHCLTIDELKRQVDLLQTREHSSHEKINELQNIVKDYEHKVETLQNKLRKISDDNKTAEDEGKTMVEKLNDLRQNDNQMKIELVVAAEKIEYLEGKCERRKMKAIHKIQSLKEKFERERRTMNAAMLSLQSSLELSRKKIQKEEEWKLTTDDVRRQLVQEKQDLLTRLTESEEAIRENLRDLRESETRLSVVEKENLDLKDKVNILLRQNEHLERLNRILEKPENQSKCLNGELNNQSLYDALNKIRLHESLNSTDYSTHNSTNAVDRTSDKSLNGSIVALPAAASLVIS